MNQISNPKQYDLEERCFAFAKRANEYVRKLPRDIPNIENGKQLVRSAGSVGANYIEANEALSKKDFVMRVKISKKEAKENRFWQRRVNPRSDGADEDIRFNIGKIKMRFGVCYFEFGICLVSRY